MQNKKMVFISIIVLIGIFFLGGYWYKNNQNTQISSVSKEQLAMLQREHGFSVGNKDAKVQIVEFFDPACGTCALFHGYVKDILKEHNGKVKLLLRYAPFHRNSNYAVKMLEGAREQGLFMETLEFMFDTQSYWIKNHVVDPQILWRMLGNVQGLDMQQLGKFMNETKADEIIKQDLEDIKKLGIDKTPSYFVNGEPLQEFGLEQLKALVNKAL